MKDKSIRDTAIITITLIGSLFLYQKYSLYKTEISKRDIKISQIEKSKLNLEDKKEKLLTQKDKLEKQIKKLKETIEKIIVDNQKDKIKLSKEYNLTIQKLKYKQQQLEQNLSLESEKKLTIINQKTKLEETIKSLEQNITAQIAEKNQIKNKMEKLKERADKIIAISNEKVKNISDDNITFQQLVLKGKNLKLNLLLEQEKEKALLDNKKKLEDMVQSLKKSITVQKNEKNQLMDRINKLKATVTKILTIAKEKEEEASIKYNKIIQNFQTKQKNLEENLSIELNKEKALIEDKTKLKNKIELLENNITAQIDEKTKLLDKIEKLKSTIDELKISSKEKIAQITKEYNDKFETLKSQKISIEQNLSSELKKEESLKEEKAKLEDTVKSLEENITTQIDEKDKLLTKIDELKANISGFDAILKTKISEITNEFNSKLEVLKKQKESMEENLSIELEKEKALFDEKNRLSNMVSLLENNITTQIDTKSKLVAKVDELKTTIDSISQKAKEEKEKITQEFNAKLQELEAQKASIEENLTKQTEKLKKVMDTNSKLKEELIQQKANFEEQLKIKESEIEKLQVEKEEAIKKEEAKQELIKTFLLTNVQFKRGSSQLTDESKARLDKTAQKILEYPNFKYEIQGHTDKSGKEEYNIKLSTQRAEATKKYLVSKGVPEEILTTKGFGSSQPIADNKTKEGRIKNRRVVFVIKD